MWRSLFPRLRAGAERRVLGIRCRVLSVGFWGSGAGFCRGTPRSSDLDLDLDLDLDVDVDPTSASGPI